MDTFCTKCFESRILHVGYFGRCSGGNSCTGKNLLLKSPHISNTYFLPVKRDSTSSKSQKFTVLVSIFSVAPQNSLLLRVSNILGCTTSSALRCVTLKPDDKLKLIPNPISGRVVSVPGEGSDESEGIVLHECHVPYIETEEQSIGVKVDDGAHGQGWGWASIGQFFRQLALHICDSFDLQKSQKLSHSHLALLMSKHLTINVPMNEPLSTSFTFPDLRPCSIVWPLRDIRCRLAQVCQRHCQCIIQVIYAVVTDGTPTYAHIPGNGNTLFPFGEPFKSLDSFAHRL
jgi:hypothetical protein